MPEGQITEEELKNMSPEQIAELQKQNCIFCHINEGKIPAKKIYEDDLCFAILDINPATKGHMLLIPKEHVMVLPQASEDLVKHLGNITKKLSLASIRALGVEGTNIFIANGAVAGQRAPHAMIHIIPRTEGDHVSVFELPEKSIPEDTMKQLQQGLTQRLGTNLTAPVPEVKEEVAPVEPKAPVPQIKEEVAAPTPKIKEEPEVEKVTEEEVPPIEPTPDVEEPKVKKKKVSKKKKEELEEVNLDDLANMLE